MLHLPSYLTGIAFHLGALAGLGLLLAHLAAIEPPTAARWPALAGVVLLAKRIATPHLRKLSNPDDFLANLLTTVFAALAGGTVLAPALRDAWLSTSAVLLLYVPVGKIRHCVFFFSTRAHLGGFFGYRGVFPARESATVRHG